MHNKFPFYLFYIGCSLAIVGVPVFASDRLEIMESLYATDFTENVEEEVKLGLSLEGEVGFILATGNTSTSSTRAGLDATHETQEWSNRYTAEFLYTESRQNSSNDSTRATAQRIYTLAQADYKLLDPTQRIFMFADYEDDRFNGFDYQSSVAAGWSELRWNNESSSFRYTIGPGYNFSKRSDGYDDDTAGIIVRASVEYRYKWSSGARLRQFFSTAAGDDNTRSRSETSISANILDELAMKVSVRLDHNSSPNSEDAQLNTETSVAVIYQFF